jgi:hypothetical protein
VRDANKQGNNRTEKNDINKNKYIPERVHFLCCPPLIAGESRTRAEWLGSFRRVIREERSRREVSQRAYTDT